MAEYRVELRGDVREVYSVTADSAEEAAKNWMDGALYVSETGSMEVVSVKKEDD